MGIADEARRTHLGVEQHMSMTNPDPNHSSSGTHQSFVEFCRHLAPHLEVVSVSQPEPHLADSNVVAICPDVETARSAVLSLESIEDDDAQLGLVVMSSPRSEPHHRPRADPEQVTGGVIRRVVLGGLLGAAIGAVTFGIVAFLIGGWTAALGAALGGIGLGGLLGAIWATFAGFGGSDAYRQTFVDPELDSVGVVLKPIAGPRAHDLAYRHLSSIDGATIIEVDGSGTITSEPPRRASA